MRMESTTPSGFALRSTLARRASLCLSFSWSGCPRCTRCTRLRHSATRPSVDDFIAQFRTVDVRGVVPEDLLTRVYTSVRRERIEQASDNSIFSMTPDIEATMVPAKLPTRLTYRTPSDVFTISIPEPDRASPSSCTAPTSSLTRPCFRSRGAAPSRSA